MVDRGGRLDLRQLRALARLGRQTGLTQIWDLVHFGYPDDLDPFTDAFVERLAVYARATAKVIREESDGPTYYTVVNEISYFSWAGAEVGYFAPYAHGQGMAFKRVLVRAAIEATNAIWEVDPGARVVSVDPLVRTHSPVGRPDLQADVDHFNRHVVPQAFDMLAGRVEPELGGSREHLGIVGLNYYSGNQWAIGSPGVPQASIERGDRRWVSLSSLLMEYQDRYGGPLVISETGASAINRPGWIAYLADEVRRALEMGVNLQGVCWYPVVTTPDWEDTTAFFDGGLFDVSPQPDGRLVRVPAVTAIAALREAQAALDPEHVPANEVGGALIPPPNWPSAVVRPLESIELRADNFSHRTVSSGESSTIEIYCVNSGGHVAMHRHDVTEHALTCIAGVGEITMGDLRVTLHPGETVHIAAGVYHSITNPMTDTLVMQQVSAPKPWDSTFGKPQPMQ